MSGWTLTDGLVAGDDRAATILGKPAGALVIKPSAARSERRTSRDTPFWDLKRPLYPMDQPFTGLTPVALAGPMRMRVDHKVALARDTSARQMQQALACARG